MKPILCTVIQNKKILVLPAFCVFGLIFIFRNIFNMDSNKIATNVSFQNMKLDPIKTKSCSQKPKQFKLEGAKYIRFPKNKCRTSFKKFRNYSSTV